MCSVVHSDSKAINEFSAEPASNQGQNYRDEGQGQSGGTGVLRRRASHQPARDK
jgi:hypothetical protein